MAISKVDLEIILEQINKGDICRSILLSKQIFNENVPSLSLFGLKANNEQSYIMCVDNLLRPRAILRFQA